MKKVREILIILCSILYACNVSKPLNNIVSSEQIDTSLPIVIRANIENNYIFGIDFPIAFQYKNKTSSMINIRHFRYFYNTEQGKK